MRLRSALAAVACLAAIACGQGVAQTRHPDELQISVLRDGTIKVNGLPADLVTLDAALDGLKAKGGGLVAYYREGADQAPSPELQAAMMEVLEGAIARELPIRMSSKPDFSDSIDDEGRSRPYPPDTKDVQ